jgi:hypothetical protein
MTLCERVARARLQVPFERHRATFVGEFDDNVYAPRLAGSGVRRLARVVSVKPCGEG